MALNYQIVPPYPLNDPVEVTSEESDDTETSSFEKFRKFLGGVVILIAFVILLWGFPASSSGGRKLGGFLAPKMGLNKNQNTSTSMKFTLDR